MAQNIKRIFKLCHINRKAVVGLRWDWLVQRLNIVIKSIGSFHVSALSSSAGWASPQSSSLYSHNVAAEVPGIELIGDIQRHMKSSE